MWATSRPTLSLSRPWLPRRKAPLASSGTRGPLGNDLRPLDLFSFGCSNLYNHTKAQLLNSSGLLVQQGIKAQIRFLLFWGESCGGWLVKSLFCLNSCGYLAGFLVIFFSSLPVGYVFSFWWALGYLLVPALGGASLSSPGCLSWPSSVSCLLGFVLLFIGLPGLRLLWLTICSISLHQQLIYSNLK